ncbi:neutral/alkaline non-lysosomal ceramidase N-terminal domain-containing protein [Companilactobacillus paralimentarius]|nr:neutral/alkaline non-lysosomal ceramidase N-terminal domain-containing protein [Companilactobacillus paralimentarius]KAE9562351.1 hypothetical protein ATN96_12405 [Companilactobacillus paralimentarius]QFR68792.1 hypothetical protein LP238_02380 [Companilactobacillus paralimentarius]
MYIGYDTNKITPNVGVQMEGYTPRYSDSIHDDLFESVLYIENKYKLLLISLDIVALPGFRVDRIKRLITEMYGIDSSQIIIAAIHTHSGPTVTDLLIDNPEINSNYWQLITNRIVKSVAKAINDIKEVSVTMSSSRVNHLAYGNRNVSGAPFNDEMIELKFWNNGQMVNSLLSIATHPTVMNVNNKALTSDLIGQIRQNYKRKTGVTPIIFLADCGDTSTRFTRKESTFEEVKRIASLVTNSLNTTDFTSEELTDMNVTEVNYNCYYDPITSPTANELWLRIKNDYEKDKSKKGILDTYKHIRYYGHTHFTTSAYIYDFPELRIVTYPGELVYALGGKIREADSKKTILITLANDYRGYSVDKSEFGKYFESYNSVFLKGMADEFVEKICQRIKY